MVWSTPMTTENDIDQIRRNITDRQAAERLALIVGELVDDEVGKLPSDASREKFWALVQQRWSAHFPEPQGTFTGQEPYNVEEIPDSDDEVNNLVDEIDNLAGAVPTKGMEFAESCCGTARSIAETVEERGRVTTAQLGALRNMRDALKRWIRE